VGSKKVKVKGRIIVFYGKGPPPPPPNEIFFSRCLESYHSVIKTLHELNTFSHIYSNRHQRSVPFWDFMQHTFQDNVLVPIFKCQADCLSFEDGMSRNFGKKLSCIKSQKNRSHLHNDWSLKSCKQTAL